MGRLRLRELVENVSGRCGLLLDLKADRYSDCEARALVERALAAVDGFAGTLAFCGSWRLLDITREMRPQAWLHYAVDSAEQWRAIQPRLGGEAAVRGITVRLSLLSEDRAAALREAGIRFFCWDVHSLPEAERAAALGAAGIIAGEIEVLRALAESRRVER